MVRELRNLSPQMRLAVFKNRMVGAVWLLILSGVLTMAEPFTRLYKLYGVSLGLLTPGVLAGFLGQNAGSNLHMAVAAACGTIVIVLGVLTGFNRMHAAVIGAAVLALDLPLVLADADLGKIPADALFPLIITGVIRFIFIRGVVRGILAAGRRRELMRQMEEADREYDSVQRAKAQQNKPNGNKQQRYDNYEEEEYQG